MNRKHKVIVIEDDKDINRLIVYNLEKEGFEAISVYDGLEARKRLQSDSFEVVVLDIMLPGIDGFDICKDIKEDPEAYKTFVIMLTAKSSAQDKIHAHLLGADGYITKPFNVSSLVSTVRELSSVRDKDFTVTLD